MTRSILLSALLALAATASPAVAEPLRAGETRVNVPYANWSGLSLLADIKSPPHPNGFAILHIPGSGWQAPPGWSDWALKGSPGSADVEQPFLDAGFTIITIDHRATPGFKYPAAVEDAQRAARFVRAHLADWGLHPGWLGLFGGSSGGHLVAMLATMGEGSDAGLSAPANGHKAQCVVAAMAPTDLAPLGRDGWGVALATNFMGVTAPFPEEARFPGYDARLQPWLDASPINHIGDGSLPRFLLVHGDADKLVPVGQSRAFAAALRKAGATVDLIEMPGVGHAMPAPYPAQAAAWMKACLAATRPK